MKIEINIDDRLIERIRKFFTKKNIIIIFMFVFVTSIVTIRAAVTLHEFEANTPIKSSEINENFANLQAQIDANTAQIVANTTQIGINTPVGTIIPFAGRRANLPTGWMHCDGTAISRTEYSALFAVMDTAWGAGDGSSTFNLPDFRGRFLRNVDNPSTGTDPDAATRFALYTGGQTGNAVGSYQDDAIRNITGTSYGGVVNSYGTPAGALRLSYTFSAGGFDDHGSDPYTMIVFDASQAPGVKVGSDNRPKNANVYYIIKVN